MSVPSDLTQEEWDLLVSKYQSGATARELSAEYGINRASLRDAFNRKGVLKGDVATVEEVGALEELSEEDISLQVRHDSEIETLKASLRHTRRLYQASLKEASITEALVETMKDTIVALPPLRTQPITVPKYSNHGLHTAVGLVSDIHIGEVVDKEVMAGFGEYNLEIFRQRAGLWLKKMLLLVEIERMSREVPKLVLFFDGDFVSGLIHDELLKTNEINVQDQMVFCGYVMAWAIRELSRHFEEIHISCTVGNHGRNSQKIEFKEPHVNWDYQCYQQMAQWTSRLANVTWDIPKSLWTITKVEKIDFLHLHGHGKMYNALGIPYYGIDRAIKDFRELYYIQDKSFDAVCMGHYHHFMEKDLGTGPLLMNPCWKGGDEYATMGLRKWSKPAQVLFLVHEEIGYVGSQLIHLFGQKEEDAKDVPTHAPTIWADGIVDP